MSVIAENITFDQNAEKMKRSFYSIRLINRFLPVFLMVVSDFIFLTLSFIFQYFIVFRSGIFQVGNPDISILILPAIALLLYWQLLFMLFGLYKNWYEHSPFDEFFSILKITIVGCGLIFFVLIYEASIQRMMILVYFANVTFLILVGRVIVRKIQTRLRRNHIICYPAIIFGNPLHINNLIYQIQNSPNWGIKPLGIVLPDDPKENNAVLETNLPVFGTLKDLESIISTIRPQEIIITAGKTSYQDLFNIVSICTDKKLDVKIEPDLYSIFTGQTRTHNIYGIPLIQISPQLLKPWQEIIKRAFDIIFSFLVIAIGLPIWLLIALLIRIESKGDVLYTQIRSGKNNKVFKMYKFRSMVVGADKKGGDWTEKNDPRVTRIGRLIRKTHIDEIPQFFNVLKGDMSIVGPRPEQPQLVEEFTRQVPYYIRRLKVRPGITGWWQVKYQPYEMNLEEIENRLKDDFYYIENMSMRFDLEIIFRTVWVMLSGHGQA